MVWPLSNEAQNAISGSYTMDVQCTVFSPLYGVLDNLPISGGSIEADAGSQVRRTGSISADPSFWKKSPGELLTPYGSAIQIKYGIGLPSGDFEYVPVGYLEIDRTTRELPVPSDSGIDVKLVDRSARVAEDRFDVPTQTLAGATGVAEVIRLIRESLGPDIQLLDQTIAPPLVPLVIPVLDMASSRWADGIEKIADALAAEVFFDQIGRVIVRPQPTLADPAAWSITTGRGGNLLKVSDAQSREFAINKWVVTGERSDGTPPVYAVVVDDDPNSPLVWGGPAGKKSDQFNSPLATTADQCLLIAKARREASRGLSEARQFTITPHPGLEPGDVLPYYATEGSGEHTMHILDKVSTPLTPVDAQELTTRAIVLPTSS